MQPPYYPPPYPVVPFQPQGRVVKIPPARVDVALEFLGCLVHKTQTRLGVNDSSFYELSGQELSKAELNAQASAVNMLNAYFTGNLEPNVWEKAELENQRDDIPNCELPPGGRVIACPACVNDTTPGACALCQGCRQLMTFPLGEDEGDVQ